MRQGPSSSLSRSSGFSIDRRELRYGCGYTERVEQIHRDRTKVEVVVRQSRQRRRVGVNLRWRARFSGCSSVVLFIIMS